MKMFKMELAVRSGLMTVPVVLAVIVLGACSAPATPSINLDQTHWALISIDGKAVPEGVTATIAFENGQVSGSTGCNQYGGGYTTDGSRVIFSEIVSTLMACEESVMGVESAFTGALQGTVTVNVQGQTLTLTGADGTVLVFSKQ